ncbi:MULTISPECIES: hypothetical protein [unclassified Leucobacter]
MAPLAGVGTVVSADPHVIAEGAPTTRPYPKRRRRAALLHPVGLVPRS